jgi:hypothetical protein
MSKLGEIMDAIIQNERANDRNDIDGIVASFQDPQELMAWVSELDYGINGSLINKFTKEPDVYRDVHYTLTLEFCRNFVTG